MAVDHLARQAEFDADPAHFVLEQFPQRFDQLEFHVRRQAADVVMALDDVCLAGLAAGRLDDIRIVRAMREELHVRHLRGFHFEYIYEQFADYISLGLWNAYAIPRPHTPHYCLAPTHNTRETYR